MPAVPFIVAKKVMFARKEAFRGVLEDTWLAIDRDVRLYGLELEPELDMHMREYATGRHSKMAAIPGKSGATVKFKHDFVVPTDMANDVPPSEKLLECCGQRASSTRSLSTNMFDYWPDPLLDVGDTLSIVFVYPDGSGTDGIACVVKGAMGNCVISCDGVGHKPVMDYTFKGALVGIGLFSDLFPGETIPAEDYIPAPSCSTFKGGAVTQSGDQVYFGKFSLDYGNTVEMLEVCKAGEPTGYEAAYISKREPKLSWNNLALLGAGVGFAIDSSTADWQAGVEFAVDINTNKVDASFANAAPSTPAVEAWMQIIAPKAQIMSQKTDDMKGALAWDRDLELHEDPGVAPAHSLRVRATAAA